MPAAAIVLLVGALLASGVPARSPDLTEALRQAERLSWTELALLVLTVSAVSLFLQPVLSYIGDAFKGVPLNRSAQFLFATAYRRKRSRQRYSKVRGRILGLALQAEEGQLRFEDTAELASLQVAMNRWPKRPERMVGTALGDLLAALDEYPERYGLDLNEALPRLRNAAPSEVIARLDRQLEDLQFAVDLAAALALGAVTSACLLASHPKWLSLPAVVLLLAWLAYRNTLTIAVQYGESIRVLFDLYRFTLYEAMHLPLPATAEEEIKSNQELAARLWSGSEEKTLRYSHPAAVPDPDRTQAV